MWAEPSSPASCPSWPLDLSVMCPLGLCSDSCHPFPMNHGRVSLPAWRLKGGCLLACCPMGNGKPSGNRYQACPPPTSRLLPSTRVSRQDTPRIRIYLVWKLAQPRRNAHRPQMKSILNSFSFREVSRVRSPTCVIVLILFSWGLQQR